MSETLSEVPAQSVAAVNVNPVRLFFSYAREDSDIVAAFYKAFEDLGDSVFRNIRVFRDTSSVAASMLISATIREALEETDYLVVFYTGTLKRSHSWTGIEVGFFEALMEADIKREKSTSRKIIPIYIDHPPTALNEIQGISINIEKQDLNLGTDDYKKRVLADPDTANGLLARFLKEVAHKAEEGLPPLANRDPVSIDGETAARIKRIETEIVPGIKVAMFHCLGNRVARSSIEQRLIEIEFFEARDAPRAPGIPDTAKLTEQGGAFGLFKIDRLDGMILWKDFCGELTKQNSADAAATIRAIERVFETALSEGSNVDNDQLVRAPKDGKLYRVLVTRHFDYFNGRKVVHMYFIEKLKRGDHGKAETVTLLAFLNVAARYRAIFIEADSAISPEAFKLETDPLELQSKVRLLQKEIILIEDDAAQMKLDDHAALLTLHGNRANVADASENTTTWQTIRRELFDASARILAVQGTDAAYPQARRNFLKVLDSFGEAARKINTQIASLSMEQLARYFKNAKRRKGKAASRSRAPAKTKRASPKKRPRA
ncbi:toll/interleukin-1 receptor domain-containing protein [Bradyrhizobium vignae]|uniref:TIR domain-containing protein n=1 Tax=Bradyrhizobium vignae TaxID=1549949 RepID=A0A2U3PUH1_9BRAD|nr:toll/interleukin-1 receptor domain-containing protein [Bradyrhizobium vignae]SPP92769.1 conserved protein of unknown function [Bradyrhizobium vignae]